MPKIVTKKELLEKLAQARSGDVSKEVLKELKEAKKQPNKWFMIEATTSSSNVRRIIKKKLKESVKTRDKDGKWQVRRLGSKRKNKKLVKKGRVYVRYGGS